MKVNNQFIVSGYIFDKTNNAEISLDKMIQRISVKKDFNINIFPMFVVDLQVNYDIREILRKNNINLVLNVYEYNMADEIDDSANFNPVATSQSFSTTLKIFDKNIRSLDMKKDKDNENNEMTSQLFNIQLSGIPENLYNKNNTIINTVYNKASNNEILIDLLASDNTNLYFDPSDNSDRLETLLIPPLSLSNAIAYLQNNYGLYDSNYKLFFDTNATYLLKEFNADRLSKNKLSINVISQNSISDSSIYEELDVDENENLQKIVKEDPIIITNYDVASNILGGNAIYGSYDANFNLVTRQYTHDKNETKIRYFWNDNDKDIFEKMHQNIQYRVGSLVLENISPRLFSLLTQIEIDSPNDNIRGSYNIQSLRFSISTGNFKNYSSQIVLTFSK